MKRVLFPLLSGLLCLSFFSCGGDFSSPLSEEGLPEHPSINVVFSPNGPGDNGYLDKMLNAATVYSIAHPGAMRMIMPCDSLEAKGIFQNLDDIAKDEAVKDTVLSIFVGSEYQKTSREVPIDVTKAFAVGGCLRFNALPSGYHFLKSDGTSVHKDPEASYFLLSTNNYNIANALYLDHNSGAYKAQLRVVNNEV